LSAARQGITIPFPGTAGIGLHGVQAGSSEPAFLLLHGFTLNSTTWDNVIADFAAIGRTVAYDRIPFGRSQKLLPGDWSGPNPYTPDSTLDQLAAVMDELELSRAIVVGSSAGGQLAARAAIELPVRVCALILVCAAVYGGPPQRIGRMLDNAPMNLAGPSLARLAGNNAWLLKKSFARPERIGPGLFRDAALATRDPGWNRALWEFIKVSTVQPDITGRLGTITRPTLVIGGARDRVVPASLHHRLAGAIPGAELRLMPDTGHLPHQENPGGFMAEVRDWLDNTAPGRAAMRGP